MPKPTPHLILADGTTVDCGAGGVLGRQGDIAREELAREAVLSRRHLLLQQFDGVWFLTLLPDARNPTWLDGEEMKPGMARQLFGDHDLQVGERFFGLSMLDPALPGGAHPHPPASWPSGPAGFGSEPDLYDDLPPGSTVPADGGDLSAALDGLRDLPGQSLLLDDDLRLWWLSSDSSARLGPQVGPGSDFLTLVDGLTAPAVRRELEDLRASGGSVDVPLPGAGGPLHFSYRFPFFLGHTTAAGAPGAAGSPGIAGGLLGSLAGHALSRAFQDGDVAKAVTLVTAASCRDLDCRRVAVWMADGADLVCRGLQARDGSGVPGARVRMKYCPAFFEAVCGSPPIATARDGEPVWSILKEIGFVDAGSRSVLATAVQQGGTFHGLLAFERDGDGAAWGHAEKDFAVCAAALCLLAMQTRRNAENVAELQEKEAQLAGGLSEARRYVRRLLPEPMHHPEVSTEWYFEPSETIGGDAFGYHWLDEDRLAMYVLDVVGHGTGAALLAVSVANALRGRLVPAEDFANPADVLSAVNRSFQMEDQGMMTFTAWYGIYNRRERVITYSSAGHPPALLVWPWHEGGGQDFRELGTEGLIIGGMDDAVYTNASIAIGPGQTKLYLYSDGAFEIPLGPNRNWTFEEFIASVRATRTMASGEPEYLYERARALCVAKALPDDFSMVRFLFPPVDSQPQSR